MPNFVIHCALPDGTETSASLLGFEDLGEALAEYDVICGAGLMPELHDCSAFMVSSEDGIEFAAVRL